MIRKTVTTVALIGLLISVGVWGVSYTRITYAWTRADIWYSYYLSAGSFGLIAVGGEGSEGWYVEGFRGFDTVWTPQIPFFSRETYAVFVPIWPTTVIFSTMCWLSHPLYHHRRWKRRKLGLCVKCGYDLRGSKGCCPECGTEFESSGVEGLGSSMGDADG